MRKWLSGGRFRFKADAKILDVYRDKVFSIDRFSYHDENEFQFRYPKDGRLILATLHQIEYVPHKIGEKFRVRQDLDPEMAAALSHHKDVVYEITNTLGDGSIISFRGTNGLMDLIGIHWIEEANEPIQESQHSCRCDFTSLLRYGCRCGGI